MPFRPALSNSFATRTSLGLPLACVAVYLLGVAALLLLVLGRTHGTFVYALDDPYIHLALAEQLAQGHYGINPGEAASPSSSLLWPFLLIPLAGTRVHRFLPLVLNLVFGSAAAWLVGVCVMQWSMLRPIDGLLGSRHLPRTKRVIVALLLLLVGNLFTLSFVGMEHCLQVLLAGLCAFGITEVLSHRPVPMVALAAAAMLPSVRYEGVGLTVALAFALFGQRRRLGPSLVLLGTSVAPLLLFSVYLHSRGLPLLPNSVMVKSMVALKPHGPLVRFVSIAGGNLLRGLSDLEYWPVDLAAVLLLHLWWHERDGERRWALAGAALAVVLQAVIGRNGWFTRYEVYAIFFATLVLVRLLAERPPFLFGYFATGLIFYAAPYIRSTQRVPAAAADVYHQQYQMHRFVTEFFRGNFAVNDIGYVSFARQPGESVIDLVGLATTESATEKDKSAAWLVSMVTRHGADLAMIYPDWFKELPRSWTPLGTLCLPNDPEIAAGRCVVFYSTHTERTPQLRAETAAFAATLPPELHFFSGIALTVPPDRLLLP